MVELTEKGVVTDAEQKRLKEENSAVMRNVAEATDILSLSPCHREEAQIVELIAELNREIQNIEPGGLLDCY